MKEKDKKQKSGNALLVVIAILLIAIIAATASVGMWAWAKYKEGATGDAEVVVAKWHFELKPGKIEETQLENFAITRTDGYTHVEDGKLAPGTHGIIPIEVDTTGTEVIMTYEIKIHLKDCPANVKFYKDEARTEEITKKKVTTADGLVDELVIKRFLSLNMVGSPEHREVDAIHTENVYWYWPYETAVDDGTGNVTIAAGDTLDVGDAGKQVFMRINATGTQVLKEPQTVAQSPLVVGDLVNFKVNGTQAKGRIINKTDDLVEIMPVDSNGKAVTVGSLRLGYNEGTTNGTEQAKTEAIASWNNAVNLVNQKAIDSYAGATRALTVEDVNRLVGYTPNPSTTQYTYTISSATGDKKFIVDNLTMVKTTENETLRAVELEGISAGDTVTLGVTYGGKTISEITMVCTTGESTNAYYYYNSSSTYPLSNYFTSTYFWLASRCVYFDSNDCLFSVRGCYSSYVDNGSLYSSNGNANGNTRPVVPVVSLPSSIQVEQDTQSGEWTIE